MLNHHFDAKIGLPVLDLLRALNNTSWDEFLRFMEETDCQDSDERDLLMGIVCDSQYRAARESIYLTDDMPDTLREMLCGHENHALMRKRSRGRFVKTNGDVFGAHELVKQINKSVCVPLSERMAKDICDTLMKIKPCGDDDSDSDDDDDD